MDIGLKISLLMTMVFLIGGCSSIQKKFSTHAYKLHSPKADTALINSVLQELWQEDSVVSYSTMNIDDFAIVRTTNGGHCQIESLLKEARETGKTKQPKPGEKGTGFRVQ